MAFAYHRAIIGQRDDDRLHQSEDLSMDVRRPIDEDVAGLRPTLNPLRLRISLAVLLAVCHRRTVSQRPVRSITPEGWSSRSRPS